MNDKIWYSAGQIARYIDLLMTVWGLLVEGIAGFSLGVFEDAASQILSVVQETTHCVVWLPDVGSVIWLPGNPKSGKQ